MAQSVDFAAPTRRYGPRHGGLLAATLFLVASAGAGEEARAGSCPLPSFGPLRPVAPGLKVDRSRRPFAVDLDGDRRPELIVLAAGGPVLLPGAGAGKFLDPRPIGLPSSGLVLGVTDLDGDGRPDLVVGRRSRQADGNAWAEVDAFLGDGRLGFSPGPVIALPAGFASTLDPVIGDFDGDGVPDLLFVGLAQRGASGLATCLLRGDGAGGWRPPLLAPLPGGLALAGIGAADFDGNGTLDLVVGWSGWHCGTAEVFPGDGHGAFGPGRSAGSGPSFAIGDLDGDGLPDLVGSCSSHGSTSLTLLSRKGGFVAGGSLPLPTASVVEVLADFNGDGNRDALLTGGRIALGDGRGSFGPPLSIDLGPVALVADLNGDGLSDLVVLDASGALSVRLNACREAGDLVERFVVPFLLDAPGAEGASYRSELTVVNRGPVSAWLESRFSPVLGGTPGSATTAVSAGSQERSVSAVPGALGFPWFGAAWGGMFRLRFSGLRTASDVAALARIRSTTDGADFGGVAFPAVPLAETLTGKAWIGWLKEGAGDRTNLAVLNPGDDDEGETVVRVTVTSTDPLRPGSTTLADFGLPPGGLIQVNRVLRTSGLGAASGYATVERVGGTAPYWAYAVVNDEASADGSIVPPLRAGAGIGHGRLVLPVLVEAGSFTSELVMTNLSSTAKRLRLEWVAEGVATADHVARLSAGLAAGEQLTVPSFVQWLRDRAVPGVGEPGAGLAGALFVSVEGGDADGLFVGARTSAAGRAGRYGVFTSALALSDLATDHAWVHGLRQDSGNRTNLAVVHAGEVGDGPAVFRVEIFDGASGLLVAAVEDLRLDERCWTQLGTVLAEAAPGLENGYARVQRTIGTAPFLAYAVVNDGSGPGLGTGDGSYVPMTVPKP